MHNIQCSYPELFNPPENWQGRPGTPCLPRFSRGLYCFFRCSYLFDYQKIVSLCPFSIREIKLFLVPVFSASCSWVTLAFFLSFFPYNFTNCKRFGFNLKYRPFPCSYRTITTLKVFIESCNLFVVIFLYF